MISAPELSQLPFLQALCWQVDPTGLSPQEVLAVYERGWRFRGVLAEPSDAEKQYIQNLSEQFQSWIGNEL